MNTPKDSKPELIDSKVIDWDKERFRNGQSPDSKPKSVKPKPTN